MINVNIKARNKLDISHDLRCALFVTKPSVSKLAMQNQLVLSR
jgi:hypothetical protein